MISAIEAKADRDLTEQELNAVTGGTVRQPTNSTILINKPIHVPPVVPIHLL